MRWTGCDDSWAGPDEPERGTKDRMTACYLRYIVALGFIFLACATQEAAWGQQKTALNEPKLKLQGLDGRIHDLADERGNVLLVSFGATWCAPCSTELRALEDLLNEYRDKPVKFFWVSIERPEEITDNALRRYARDRKVSFPILRDSAKMVFLQFSQRVRLPMIVMIGKDGQVDVPVQFGLRTPIENYKTDLRARLNKLLSERSESER